MLQRILIALDATPASERVIEYAGEMAAGREDFFVHLVHVETVRSTKLQEGASDFEKRKQESRAILDPMKARLIAAGVREQNVDAGFLAVRAESTLAEAILDSARQHECTTIAVGRNSLPWYQEILHQHPSDELVKKAQGVTLWIVE